MALFTPRGLKLRLPIRYAFTLMARVYPQRDPFRILQLTEEIDNLASLAGFTAAFAAFYLRLEPISIGLFVFAFVSVFRLVHLLGLFIPPFTFFLPVSRVYSFVSGYGILLVGLMVFGFVRSGWKGVLAFAVGRTASTLVFGLIELAYGRYLFQKIGLAVTSSERSFFHAYRLEANRFGASTDLNVSEAELASDKWELVLRDLSVKWPVVVSRFTGDSA